MSEPRNWPGRLGRQRDVVRRASRVGSPWRSAAVWWPGLAPGRLAAPGSWSAGRLAWLPGSVRRRSAAVWPPGAVLLFARLPTSPRLQAGSSDGWRVWPGDHQSGGGPTPARQADAAEGSRTWRASQHGHRQTGGAFTFSDETLSQYRVLALFSTSPIHRSPLPFLPHFPSAFSSTIPRILTNISINRFFSLKSKNATF